MINNLEQELEKFTDVKKAKIFSGFFKTGKGQYGEGDIFLGITVPMIRSIAKKYSDLSLSENALLLSSPIHEKRLLGLLILTHHFQKGDVITKKTIYDFYISHTKYINNWDLVDLTADKIVGEYLKDKDRSMLYTLANSSNLWEKRISIIATFAFIKDLQEYDDTFIIADILQYDTHDLLHKAVGWMLREVGKRISQEVEETYLVSRYKTMPRTMLRYAIERFSPEKRQAYLQGNI